MKLKPWQWIACALILAFLADWLIQRPDARARGVNRSIEAQGSPTLKDYAYRFRALRVEGDTAVMGTPRNVDMPAFRFIGAVHPEIDVRNANDAAFVAAEAELGRVQAEARSIALSRPGITAVRWELDRHWLAAHGIDVPN